MKSGRRGQIAAFLIFIIVIILVAAIALIEMSRVNQSKLNTANAADAGALAGASQLASTANMIAKMNENMYLAWLGLFLGGLVYNLLWPGDVRWDLPKFFALYLVTCTFNILAYCGLLLAGKDAFFTARSNAHSYAFNNAGISQATQRRINAPVKQEFTKWLDSRTDDGDLEEEESLTYRWHEYTFQPEEGKQKIEGEENSVTSQVQLGGKAMALLPIVSALAPIVTFFDLHEVKVLSDISIAFPPLKALIEAAGELVNSAVCLGITVAFSAGALIIFLPLLLPVFVLLGNDPDLDIILMAILADLFLPKVVCFPIPEGVSLMITWFMPLAYLVGITNVSKFKVSSWVTRHSPGNNLGLWKMNPQDVTSSAVGQVFEAGSNACSDRMFAGFLLPCYDLKLENVK